jgi:hypothetical protein
MRALILIAAAALALAACKNNDQTDNTANVDENLTAENIVSNDVTAIDAVTGDAANMAAESDVNDLGNISNDTGNVNAFPRPRPQTVSPSPATTPPPSATASNSIANATGNSD